MIAPDPMLDTPPSVLPPAPAVHPQDLPSLRLLLGSIRNSLAIWPDHAFDTTFSRNTLFGVESALIDDPSGVAKASTWHQPDLQPCPESGHHRR